MSDQQTPGDALYKARVNQKFSQIELAHQSGVSRWRIVEAEKDRLRLRPEEADAIRKVLSGEVQKVVQPSNVAKDVDDAVQKAFDALEGALQGTLTDADRAVLATKLMTLRQALGLDVVKFI